MLVRLTGQYISAGENFQQLTWQRALDNHGEIQTRYSHIRTTIDATTISNLDILNQLGLPQFRLTDSNLSERHELEVQHTVHVGESNRVVWGGAYRTDFVDAANYFLTPIRQNEYRLFTHDEWRINPAWILNSGVMLENSGLGRTDISPKFALNHHITPAHTLRAGISRAYRNPAMLEEKGNWRYPLPQQLQLAFGMQNYQILQAMGGLRPEQVLSQEIGYLGKLVDHGVSIDVRIFHDQYSNIVVVDNSTAPPGFTNTSLPMEQSGAETSIEYRPTDQARVIFNYSRNRISTTLNGFTGNMPEEQFSMMYAQKIRDYSFSLNYYNQSAAFPADRSGSTTTDLQPQHQRIDLRLAKSFQSAGGASGEAALVIQNLFNTDYTEYIATNVFNRCSYVKITVNF